ncbi:hypothetical protein MPL3365_260025 [Mesorhizobium plurifarium]|uniref:Uncharacterized protein n=1 Tax=Mesorhizobium plurifarium TaxID=69974 RepID=A0A090GC77_MESPL|nr:hypothetical protein MPL3365_260025 [Mesorhizobium plurifarium]
MGGTGAGWQLSLGGAPPHPDCQTELQAQFGAIRPLPEGRGAGSASLFSPRGEGGREAAG